MGAIRLRVVTEAVRVGEMPGDVSSNLGEYRGRFDTWGHLTLKPTAGVSHPLCRHGFRLTSSQTPVSHLALLSLSHHPFSLPSFPPIFLVCAVPSAPQTALYASHSRLFSRASPSGSGFITGVVLFPLPPPFCFPLFLCFLPSILSCFFWRFLQRQSLSLHFHLRSA